MTLGAMQTIASHGWRVAVDVGGTFTDLIVHKTNGELVVVKVLSVPEDPARGVFAAFERAAQAMEIPLRSFVEQCELCIHGSTVATNTLLERKGARVGLLTTEGFRDSLEIRRGFRRDPWRHREAYPDVLVPRYLRLPVRGRIDKHGGEHEALNAGDVSNAADIFAQEEVESVAVALFNSYLNGAHESACKALLEGKWNRDRIALSSETIPVMGEYERTSTTVLSAYLAPRTVTYLQNLDRGLRELGLRRPLLLIQNNGGAISVEQAGREPVRLLLSGPAAGVGAMEFYSAAIGSGELISMEIGGTSCDSILMSGGRTGFTDRVEVDECHLALPAVDVHTIGAGGGTIAGVDAAGLMFVGPHGAGASPGPACYGLGGTSPTVTDAQLVLGRLKAETYADGVIKVDPTLAHAAIARELATPLGIDVDAAASGVIRLMEQKLLHALQRISIERGHDPSKFTLIAGGGGGGLHGAEVGRLLGCRRVYVPRLAGAFCALGMLNADVRHDFLRVHLERLECCDAEALQNIYSDLEAQGQRTLETEGFSAPDISHTRSLDLRYIGQQWTINVAFGEPRFDAQALRQRFESAHESLFGHIQPGGIIDVTMARVTSIGHLPRIRNSARRLGDGGMRPIETRRVWLNKSTGWTQVPIYDGRDATTGCIIHGPAIVNERTTTILVGAHDELNVDAGGNYMIELG